MARSYQRKPKEGSSEETQIAQGYIPIAALAPLPKWTIRFHAGLVDPTEMITFKDCVDPATPESHR
jgi:hypothetical protein